MEGWLSSSIGWIVRGQTNNCYYKMFFSEQSPNWVFCIVIPSQYTIIQVQYLISDVCDFQPLLPWYNSRLCSFLLVQSLEEKMKTYVCQRASVRYSERASVRYSSKTFKPSIAQVNAWIVFCLTSLPHWIKASVKCLYNGLYNRIGTHGQLS